MKNKLKLALEKIKTAEEKIKNKDSAAYAACVYSADAAHGYAAADADAGTAAHAYAAVDAAADAASASYAALINWKKAEEKIKKAREIIEELIKYEK